MTRTFDYIFTLRKPKNYVSGPVRIFLRLTVDGKRCETATSQFADPYHWDKKRGRIEGKSEVARSVNADLGILQSKLYQAHADLLQSDVPITVEMLRNKFTGKGERSRNLIAFVKTYHQTMSRLVGIDYVQATVDKFE